MKNIFTAITFIFLCQISQAQADLPTDYLSKEFHAQRRQALRDLMPPNSAAIIFSYPERTFSNDVTYVYHQNPDLYYFSGYNEPDAVLLVFKEMQGSKDAAYNELMFVRRRDSSQEIWTGRRLGVEGTKNKLGFKYAFEGKNFAAFPIDYSKFSVVLHDVIPADIPNDKSGFDLYGLLNSFKNNLHENDTNDQLHMLQQNIVRRVNVSNLSRYIQRIKNMPDTNNTIKNDPGIQQLLASPDSATLEAVKQKFRTQMNSTDVYAEITNNLRGIKTSEELALMRKAVKISSIAHSEVMKAVTPAMSEREAEGIHFYIHKKYGGEDEGYPPIVGAGANGCILHYEENSATKINNQLLLMDVGCEYHGYSADVTRTIPASGKFTPEQKAIYQLVYDAQEAVFMLCTEGHNFGELQEKSKEVLAAGLIKLGIIKDKKEVGLYYPHGVSHHLGLDVHDKGGYDLKENMVITVEPGIYIPAGSNCDKKWWNIGVRIEDDVRIGKQNCEILSAYAPRKWEDVEKKEAEKSEFNEMTLQPL